MLTVKDVISQFPAPAARPPCRDGLFSVNLLLKAALMAVLCHSGWKATNTTSWISNFRLCRALSHTLQSAETLLTLPFTKEETEAESVPEADDLTEVTTLPGGSLRPHPPSQTHQILRR